MKHVSYLHMLAGMAVLCPGVMPAQEQIAGKDAPMQTDLRYWYDSDGDGLMEFTLSETSLAGNTQIMEPGFYRLEPADGGRMIAVKYKDFPSGADGMMPCNIDNDGTADYVDGGNGLAYIDGSKLQEFATDAMVVCDYNNDGRADFLLDGRSVAVQLADGAFRMQKYETYTQEEYRNRDRENSEWNPTIGGSNIVSTSFDDAFLSGEDMFIGSGNSYNGSMNGAAMSIDFNKDGFPDIVNTASGSVMLYADEGKYVTLPMGGSIYFRDLNGDQRMDYIVHESETSTLSAHIIHADGSETEQQLISNLSLDGKIWSYDLDHDGDVDLLLPFSYNESNGASFLAVMENDGAGRFKMHERAFDEKISFKACADIDGDGYYDVLATSASGIIDTASAHYEVFMLKGDGKFGFDLLPLVQLEKKPSTEDYNSFLNFCDATVADIDRDGYYELLTICNTPDSSSLRPGQEQVLASAADEITGLINGVKPNKAPEQPEAPAFVYEASTGLLKVSWKQGRDAESSPADLSYALRIGTAPGKGDVYYAHANADGTRLNLSDGNMSHSLDKVLDVSGWNAGKYYISIQAIDPMYSGSAWSNESVFEKTRLNAEFIASAEHTVSDPVTLTLQGSKDAALTYEWELDGGQVVSQNADGSEINVKFNEPGNKRISLNVADGQGNTASTNMKLFIAANKISDSELTLEPASSLIISGIDTDCDGELELAASNGMYERTGNGSYAKIKKIYNTSLKFDSGKNMVADINRDGLADIAIVQPYGTDYRHIINQGDKSFSVSDIAGNDLQYGQDIENMFADYNSDGFVDLCYNMINNGTYLNFARKNDIWGYHLTADVNGDGFFDLVAQNCDESEGLNAHFFLNNGDGSFAETQIPITVPELQGMFSIDALADMNNDGYIDIAAKMNSQTVMVLLNNQNRQFDRIVKLQLPKAVQDLKVSGCFDFDNNGTPDVFVGYNIDYESYARILYLHEGMKCQMSDEFLCGIRFSPSFTDLNGDGIPDLFENGYTGNYEYATNSSTATNTRPQPPTNVRGAQGDDFITLRWDAAHDAETPASQMRYNISVKKRGADGDGAYVISPLNGMNADAAIATSYRYPTATAYSIPVSVMTAGDYEVNVQAIDAWNATSVFSETYIMHIDASPQMRIPATVHAGLPATIVYTGTASVSGLAWDWDGGEVTGTDGNEFHVVWDAEGDKAVSVTSDGVSSAVTVKVLPALDAHFEIADNTLLGAETPIKMSAGADCNRRWKASRNGGQLADAEEFVEILPTASDSECKAIFKQEGDYVLQLTVYDDAGFAESRQDVSVIDAHDYVSIGMVAVDETTGKYEVEINASEPLPDFISGIIVSKEGSRYNDFVPADTIPVQQRSFVDADSDPRAQASRYCIAAATADGIISPAGVPHKGVHVMLCKGMGNGWNVIWSRYEGAEIASYRILRGTSPEDMDVIAELSGSATSYADTNAPAGTLYYAVDFVVQRERQHSTGMRNAVSQARSNVAATDDAILGVTYAERISLTVPEDAALSWQQPSVRLSAEIYPLTATFRKTNWSITEGTDLATVDESGTVSITGNGRGNITVRASAVDGSDAYAETELVVDAPPAAAESIGNGNLDAVIYPVPVNECLHVAGLPKGGCTITIFNVQGQVLYSGQTADSETAIPCGNYPQGFYIIRIATGDAAYTGKFVKEQQ